MRRTLETELNTVQRRCGDLEERLKSREMTTSLTADETARDCRRLEEAKRSLQSRVGHKNVFRLIRV